MLGITIKNMLKYKFLTLCLFIGFILSSAVVSTVPVFANGILNQFLTNIFVTAERTAPKDPKDEYNFPAVLSASRQVRFNTDYKTFISSYNSLKRDFSTISKQIALPVITQKITMSFDNLNYNYGKDNKNNFSSNNSIIYVSDFQKHVTLVKGNLPGDTISKDNNIEVMVDELTFNNFSLELNKPYEITNLVQQVPLKIKVTGVFKLASPSDQYWRDRSTNFYCKFYVTEGAFLGLYQTNEAYGNQVKTINCTTLYDYNAISNKNAAEINAAAEVVSKTAANRLQTFVTCTITKNLKEYLAKERQYSTIMWMFLLPVIIVIMYYIVMISGFIVDADKDQIAVLKSRGAGVSEIIRIYLYEGIIISLVSALAGPLMGMLLSKLIGYTDGFMSFGAGEGISISFSSSAYIFSFLTICILLLTLLASVYFASKRSIVEVKRNKNKYLSALLKNKNMDIILLALSAYGYYMYGMSKTVPVLSGNGSAKAPIDPILYLVSTAFILGAGMFLLRLYRYAIKLIFLIIDRLNLPISYLSFTNILRYHLNRVSVMLFIVLIVGLGIFNMNIAKNINLSYENTVKYMAGTDIIAQGVWGKQLDNLPGVDEFTENFYKYFEPPYSDYSKINGIDSYTKVLRIRSGSASIGDSATSRVGTNIMGIIPHEFGKVAWFDSSLLKIHWYYYLNALTTRQDLALVSRGFSTSNSVNKGDTITVKLDAGREVKVTIYDIIDYWPGYDNLKTTNLVVLNLKYAFLKTPVMPYEVWMKKKPDVTNKVIYDSFRNEKIPLQEFKDVSLDIYNSRNDIFLRGTNAVLTLGFSCILCICIIGFLIYWMLSLRSRTLHFGVYRSLGISSGSVSAILVNEQIFTLGSSILIGIAVGKITGSLFIPLIQQIWYSSKYAIPVRNISFTSEYIQLSILLAAIFIITLLVLLRYISTLKINQAIKLGED